MKLKIKRLLYFILLCFLCVGCIVPKENKDLSSEKEKITPLLYEVTKEGSDNKLYLFGSIHVADDRAYPLPNKVMSAYKESDYLALEFDVVNFTEDLSVQMDALEWLVIQDGTTIKDKLHTDTYEKLMEYLDKNMLYLPVYEYYGSAFHYSLLSNIFSEKSQLSSDDGIDMYFNQQAKEDGKTILELESASEQHQLLASFSDDLYDFMIAFSINFEQDTINETIKLYENWLNGNHDEIIKLLESEYEVEDEDKELFQEYDNIDGLIEDYNNKLIVQRNINMTEKADAYFSENKSVFIVVGLAHIIGEDAMVSLLQEKGYEVTLVEY